jgi:hypothetical protein
VNKVWNAIAVIVLTAVAIRLVVDVLAPYAPYVIVAILVIVVVANFGRRGQSW